jgi:hypothetical protein
MRTLVLVGLCLLAPAALPSGSRAQAQVVTPDELGDVMLSPTDLPGFVMAGDVSPDPTPGRTSDQRTRFFFDASGNGGETDILTEVLLAPTADDVCLPYRPQRIADGEVLSRLNSDAPNFQLLGPLGIGDVDVAASWHDLDAGSNTWDAVFGEVFMHGRLSVYLTFRQHSGAAIDPQQVAGYARAQDAKLTAAAAAGDTGVGQLAAEPVPPTPATPPAPCS